jgi:phosphohistidine phosphatase SixA
MRSILSPCLFFIFFVFACQEKEEPANMLVSDNVEDGIVFVGHSDSGVSFRLSTNNPGKFRPCAHKPTFPISEDGQATLRLDQGVYWIDIHWANGDPLIQTVPVLVAKNIEYARNTIKMLKSLKTGGGDYALVFRHADASVGVDKPNSGVPQWWKSCDPDLARQLNATGIARSQRIGKILKQLQVPVKKAISSEFCRALQTLELMDLNVPIVIDPRLNHENANPVTFNYQEVVDALNENKMTSGVLVASLHFNIYKDNPHWDIIRPFNMTDGFLVKIGGTGDPELIGSLPYFVWDLFEE